MLRKLIVNKKFMITVLISASLLLYAVDFALLGSFKEVSIWFLGNLAFLPVYVLIVTMMIERVIKERERLTVMRKLNMVIGVFFSEVGSRLLRDLSGYIISCGQLRTSLTITAGWKDEDYVVALKHINSADLKIEFSCKSLNELKIFLISKRSFLVSLLENQNLLEHEEFTDLLWAVFHLLEELEAREGFSSMPQSDIDHINGDIKRVVGHLMREWILYMQHLKHAYPYLFSLAVRLNPMLEVTSPIVY